MKNTTSSTTNHPKSLIPDNVAVADAGLRDAANTLNGALDALHTSEDEAWQAYSADVKDALAQMNAQLEVATAQIKAARSETRADLSDALRQAAEARHALVDQIRVQAALGRMEAQDRTRSARQEADEVGHRVEQLIESVRSDTVKTWSDVFHDTTEAIGHVRNAVRNLATVDSGSTHAR